MHWIMASAIVFFMSCDVKHNVLKFDRAVPRYTSYPTAPRFQAVDNIVNPYSGVSINDTISLYIHVPFCAKMCWYCGCHTKVTKKYEPIVEYVDLLLREIDLVAQSLPIKARVGHMHFGGGTPGILESEDFERIMQAVQANFDILDNAEIAIETDPRGLTEDRVAMYAKYGVNRCSLGSQDFNDKVMDAVNRQQPFELSKRAVNLFRKYGIDNINLDIMYGLPHQTPDTARHTMELALSLQPTRIAYFGYAHVPWMKKHMRLINDQDLPDNDLRFDLFEVGAQMLEDAGYIAVGIDHFVHPENEMAHAAVTKPLRRNFQGYTTDQSTMMIGVGVSSIGKTHTQYLQNSPDMPIYKKAIDAGKLPIVKSCDITSEDKGRGAIIERIMCDFEIDLNDYEGDYTAEINLLTPYQDAGVIDINGTHIVVHSDAKPIARLVAAAFDQYLPAATEQKHSKAV